jgi:predicted RNA methylase
MSVLDVGCFDGFYAFLAERRGAERVVAVDNVCSLIPSAFAASGTVIVAVAPLGPIRRVSVRSANTRAPGV